MDIIYDPTVDALTIRFVKERERKGLDTAIFCFHHNLLYPHRYG